MTKDPIRSEVSVCRGCYVRTVSVQPVPLAMTIPRVHRRSPGVAGGETGMAGGKFDG